MKHAGTTIALATSGLAFIAYPALRPWGEETGAAGAATFDSTAWPIAHTLGMVGFVALAFALRSAAADLPWQWSGQPVRRAESRMWVAVALLLPYYGAEAYGLHAVGGYAVQQGDPGVIDVADSFRFAPLPMTVFALGLLTLVLVGGRLAHGMWRTGTLGRTGGLLTGLGLATYLPQFFLGAELRIMHGVVLGVGLLIIATRTAVHPVTTHQQARTSHALA
ncbi:hypothetical protein ASG90_14195 [Nocardioides sp. Soil797]|nr:hypothetical protein ASG90_14195 [Nocardioides sp. Soil797]